MRWMRIATLGLALVSGLPSAHADDASRLALARQVVDVAHVSDNMRKFMPTMMASLKPMMMQQGAADAATVDAFVQRFSSRFDESTGRFADLVAQIYAKEFSDEDLANLLAFYKTPTGQNLLSKQTVIAQATFAIGKSWGEDMAKQILAEFKKEKESAPLKQ